MKKSILFLSVLLLCIACLFTSASAAMSYQEIVDLAYTLENGQMLPGTYRLYGKVIRVDTAYSWNYDNITVTIAIEGREDKPIMCYRLAGPGAPELHAGSWITVEGTLKNYKGTIEFDKGCRLLSTYREVLTGPKLKIHASFDKAEAVIGERITMSFTVDNCIDSYSASVIQRVYDRGKGKVYKVQGLYVDRYGGEIRFRPEYGDKLEYDICLFNRDGQQIFTYPISIPITGKQEEAPTLQLTPYKTEITLGEELIVQIDTTGYFNFIEGSWYVDAGSGFYWADNLNILGKDRVSFTPTEGTQIYFEAEATTDSGTFTVRTEIIPIRKGIPGDANADGTLNLSDALRILQHTAGWSVALNTATADINGDSSINAADALNILSQLAAR